MKFGEFEKVLPNKIKSYLIDTLREDFTTATREELHKEAYWCYSTYSGTYYDIAVNSVDEIIDDIIKNR